jgi:poly(hydroxyalkanoate) granule-associated protein
MTDQPKDSPRDESLQDELTKRGRDVWLAGLGALATVEEEGSKLFNRLVDRGKDFETERREELKEVSEEVSEKARKQRDEALSQLEEAGEETQSLLLETVNSALERFGVPTRSEVDRLADRVETLSEQVDNLSQTLSERTDESDSAQH